LAARRGPAPAVARAPARDPAALERRPQARAPEPRLARQDLESVAEIEAPVGERRQCARWRERLRLAREQLPRDAPHRRAEQREALLEQVEHGLALGGEDEGVGLCDRVEIAGRAREELDQPERAAPDR